MPPSGKPGDDQQAFVAGHLLGPLLGQLLPHAQVFVGPEARALAAHQIDDHALARLHALADDRQDVRMVVVLGPELARLLLAAIGHVEIREHLHHGEHHVARLAIGRPAVVPDAVDQLPRHHRLLGVIEHRAVGAAVGHFGDQLLDQQIAGRLPGGDQIGLVGALVRRVDRHQIDRRALFVVGLPLGLELHADFVEHAWRSRSGTSRA